MALFKFENKKVKQVVSVEADDHAKIKVLGSGCAKCNQLEANVREALDQLGIKEVVGHVSDFAKIATYGVMTTPALVIGDKVVSYGKVLKVDEAVALIQKHYIIEG